ncbi:molybdate ABC transporter substrate-binding protein [Parerythrobacter lacustris]|uniref:Molybdate ABC transporter substrate-binding protein n=1 Tax=Parerythrobacter lacustris TaxID=2969984 RepID=A0ABT1XNB4_9SPHN|nr:molybdate ABC transporter substrate-binding protein [Parerythrobacter lacustris]MCR2833149.1 molybdate ABC transporter substrate-binding protein [Parerythrobacter lacustris]
MFRGLLALLFSLFALVSCAPSEPKGPVVLAASSLQAPLEELAEQWRASGRPPPVLSFASSPALARQVQSGAPGDIFISADREWIDYLAQQGDLDEAGLRTIASNSLVLARHDDGTSISREEVLSQLGEVPLATGDPETVPLGRYARQALTSEGLWDKAESSIVPTQSARAAMVLVKRGEAPLGMLYASDVAEEADLETVLAFSRDSHDPIDYIAMILPASGHPDARGFLEFLASPKSAAVFARHGFKRP